MKPTSEEGARVSAATAQGARDHQEDRLVKSWIDLPSSAGWLLAVFDGHGGAATADKAAAALPDLFRFHLQASKGDPAKGLGNTFDALEELTRHDVSGSTASVVFISADGQNVSWAVLGDSPVALLDAANTIRIGPDHNIRSNRTERDAALRGGGIYHKGYLEDPRRPDIGLQMTRSLGDVDLARVLNRKSEVESIPLGGKGIVLVGTDGLFGTGATSKADDIARALNIVRDGANADAIIQDALRRKTGDNVSAVVWRKD